MPIALLSLPTYPVPGQPGKELMVNVVIYAMAAALVLSLLWVLLPFVHADPEDEPRETGRTTTGE